MGRKPLITIGIVAVAALVIGLSSLAFVADRYPMDGTRKDVSARRHEKSVQIPATPISEDDCPGCDSDDVRDSGRARLRLSAEFQLLIRLVAAERRPESVTGRGLRRLEKAQLAGIGVSNDEAGLNELRRRVPAKLRQALLDERNPQGRALIYQYAFDCDIDPAMLIVELDDDARDVIDAARRALALGTVAEVSETVPTISKLPDSKEKAAVLFDGYVRAAAADSDVAALFLNALYGIPCSDVVDNIGKLLDRNQVNDREHLIRILGESRTRNSIEHLIQVASNDSNSDDEIRVACLQLAKWAFLPEVRTILEARLVGRNGASVANLVDSTWGVQGSREMFARIVRNAVDKDVSLKAIEILGRYSYDGEIGKMLWDIASDEKLDDERRSEALLELKRSFVLHDSNRTEALNQWENGNGKLAAAAKNVLNPADKVIPGPTKSQNVRRYLKAREYLTALRDELEARKNEWTVKEKERYRRLTDEIGKIDSRIEKFDPNGELQQELELARLLAEYDRLTEERAYLNRKVQTKPEDESKVELIDREIQELEKQLDSVVPEGKWKTKRMSNGIENSSKQKD